MNKKTKKKLETLYVPELKELIRELNLRNYTKLLKAGLIKKILNDSSEVLILKSLLRLNFLDENEIEWKWKFFKRTIQWKEKPKIAKAANISSIQYNGRVKITFYQMLILSAFFSIPLYFFKSNCSLPLFDITVCENINKNHKAKIVENVIDLNYQIHKHSNYEDSLKKILAHEVFWFKPPQKSKERIHFGNKKYDKFCFCQEPEIHYPQEKLDETDYDISSLGAYRFNEPKEKFYQIQRVKAEIRNGKITSITSYNEDAPEMERMNDFYDKYWLVPIFCTLGLFTLFLIFSAEFRKTLLSIFRFFSGGLF